MVVQCSQIQCGAGVVQYRDARLVGQTYKRPLDTGVIVCLKLSVYFDCNWVERVLEVCDTGRYLGGMF